MWPPNNQITVCYPEKFLTNIPQVLLPKTTGLSPQLPYPCLSSEMRIVLKHKYCLNYNKRINEWWILSEIMPVFFQQCFTHWKSFRILLLKSSSEYHILFKYPQKWHLYPLNVGVVLEGKGLLEINHRTTWRSSQRRTVLMKTNK